jgi:hypothetical protein
MFEADGIGRHMAETSCYYLSYTIALLMKSIFTRELVVSSKTEPIMDEAEELARRADQSLLALVNAYEPLEDTYSEAVSSYELVIEVVNTASVPRALIATAISAR